MPDTSAAAEWLGAPEAPPAAFTLPGIVRGDFPVFERHVNGHPLAYLDSSFSGRSLNEGFSGGEKKRAEIVQLQLLNPKYAILDETDSGLDIDALRVVADGVNKYTAQGDRGVLLITHYTRILNYIKPDFVHVFVDGRIAEEGGPELADNLEAEGYDRFVKAARA